MKKKFIIPFSGLKLGSHSFEFEIGDSFFINRDYCPYKKGELQANVEFEKKETMLVAIIHVEGIIETTCDRCNGEMELPIDNTIRFIYKFGDEELGDEGIVVIPESTYELDVSHQLYETIISNIPLRTVHPIEDCDPDITAFLTDDIELEEEQEDETDPRWSGLSDLKFNEN